ncbi:hypothetical protein PTKIN_Ptkin09bG0283200 [Pterospermum kingtungense]
MDKLDIEDPEPCISTIFSHFDPYDAMVTSFLQTAPIQPLATENGPYDYTTSGNPMQDVLKRFLVKLEKADQAFCFRSNMAALDAATRLVGAGQEIVAGDDISAGSDDSLSQIPRASGVVVKRVNISDLSEVAAVIGPRTKLVWLESPTNLGLQIADLRRIAEMAHAYGAVVLVDSTIMSPVLLQPLKLGADIVMHAATTLIAGHIYATGVVFAVKGESLAKKLCFLQNAFRSLDFSTINCYHCLSGIKTMALRVEKQQENAQKIAEFLASHPFVKKVNYVGLSGHPGRDLHYSQVKGAGFVLSFLTGSLALSKHIVKTTKYFTKTNIFAGSMNSVIGLPCFIYKGNMPRNVREVRGLTEDLVRISVGIEDVDDLIGDLDNALRNGPL